MSTTTLNETDCEFIRDLVLKQSAIVLGAGKGYLVEMRLNQVVRQVALSGIEKLIQNLPKNPNGDLSRHVVEAMTTNETSFSRDVKPFEALRTIVLPDVMENRKIERSLNMWCAASSSGQEPYSTMMLIREHFPTLNDWDLKFVASDLSTEMIEYCKNGSYAQHEVNRGLPALFLVKYFQRKGSQWRIKEDMRSAIDFITVNLIGPWPAIPHSTSCFSEMFSFTSTSLSKSKSSIRSTDSSVRAAICSSAGPKRRSTSIIHSNASIMHVLDVIDSETSKGIWRCE